MSQVKAAPLTCTGHSRPVTQLTFSKKLGEDTRLYLLISSCKDGYPMLRDGVSGDWIGTFLGHKGAVWCSKLTEDGAFAATASADFSVIIWSTFSGEIVATLPHDHVVRTVDFSPGSSKHSSVVDNEATDVQDDLMVVSGGQDKTVRIWNVRKKSCISMWHLNESVKSVIWISRSLIITVDFKGLIQWWDVSDVEAKAINSTQIGSSIGQVELRNDWIVAAADMSVYIVHSLTGELEKQIDLDYKVSAVALNADHTKFVTGCASDTYIRLHDFSTGELLETNKGHHGPVHAVSYSPDDCIVATGSEDGTIRLWKSTESSYGLWNNGL